MPAGGYAKTGANYCHAINTSRTMIRILTMYHTDYHITTGKYMPMAMDDYCA